MRFEYFNDARIRIAYFPSSYGDNPHPLLNLQISSIPKLIYRSNLIYLHSVEDAIQAVNGILTQLMPELELDVEQGVLERVDFFTDYFVDDHVADYIHGICQLFYPHRSRVIYSNQSNGSRYRENHGVAFGSDGYRCSFYDKYRESRDQRAFGLLRHESSIRDTNEISTSTGLLIPTLNNITRIMACNILRKDVTRLGLLGNNILGGNLALEALISCFPSKKAHRLFYILSCLRDNPTMNKVDLADFLGIQRQTLNLSLNEIKAAGIAPGMLDQNIVLPSLDLQLPGEEYKILTKLPSDTGAIRLLNQVIK